MPIPYNVTPSVANADPIDVFYRVLRRYPGNNKQWWVAKAQADDPDKHVKAGDFLPDILDKTFSGNTKAPRGHFIMDAFKKDRSSISGVGDLPASTTMYRANATCFFSGRAWWAGGDKVYYSQIIDNKSKAGLCFQEADPTSEDISDLIASDGGVVPIAEARNIIRLMPLSNGVMVFATNGLWFIGSGNGAFAATDLALSKVSAIGTKNPLAIVSMGDMIFWWSEVGIHALEQASGQFGPIPGKFGNTNIAETTIQSRYNAIPEDAKRLCKGVYDPKTNVVQWLYSSDASYNTYDQILCYDVTLQAFYPWKVSEHITPTVGPKIVGTFLDTAMLTTSVAEQVTTNAAANVTTNSLDNVMTLVYNTKVEDRPTNIHYLTAVGSSLTFSQFTNREFVDWEAFGNGGLPYVSFMETGYELLEDAMRKKQAARVFVHFRRTEDDVSNPVTSCTMRTKWDWSANSHANKWSRAVEAYRPKKMRLTTTADLTSGFPVVVSNNKVRGSGKAIQFRFECSQPGKNFDLLGWSVAYVGNTEP